MRTTSAVAVVVLVVLAGCSGALGGAQGSPAEGGTGGGDSLEGTAPPEPTPDAVPGIADGRLTNASALFAAHAESLESSGFAYRLSTHVASREADSDLDPLRIVEHTRAEAGGAPYRTVVYRAGGVAPNQTRRTWGNESMEAVNVTRVGLTGNETTLEIESPVTSSVAQSAGGLPDFVKPGKWVVTGTENGNVVLTADGFNASQFDINATRYEGRLVVSSSGVIVNASVEITGQRDRGEDALPFVMTITYDLESTDDISVTRPSWVADALSESRQSRIEVTGEEDGYVAITNTGDEPIPAGSPILILKDEEGPWTELSEPIAPGETVYVYKRTSQKVMVSREEPAGVSQPLSGTYTIRIRTPNFDEVIAEATVEV